MIVEYRDIPGHAGYQAGSDGSVMSFWKAVSLGAGRGTRHFIGDTRYRLQPTRLTNKSRPKVNLRGRRFYVHRLILIAFIGPCPPGMECCHENDDPLDNRISNLRWDTRASNRKDMVRNGRSAFGEKSGAAKLTEILVMQIRDDLMEAVLSQFAIAAKFGVTQSTISSIATGKTWCRNGQKEKSRQ